jgi:hypothetical protein
MSTETKWTKGARKVMLFGRKFLVSQAEFPGEHVAQFRNVADAHLDAAAPDLYESLDVGTQMLVAYMRLHGESEEKIAEATAAARTALASARGEG